MPDRSVETILMDIGKIIAQLGEPGSNKYFFYFEIEEGVEAPSLFQEFADKVVDVDSFPLCTLASELWYASTPARWGALRYELDGDKFVAKFDYDVKYDEDTDARSVAAVKAYFGDKPLVYPSIEEARLQRYRHRAMFNT